MVGAVLPTASIKKERYMLIEHLSLWFPNNGSKWVLQLTDCELPWIRAFKPSCKGVVVFSCVCSWFEGRSAQSWTCELFPQTFPAELWSFRAVVSATCLGCAGAAVFYYCSTLEMEAKKCLKIPNRCYCLLNPKALDSYTDCQSSHPVQAKLAFSAALTVLQSKINPK